MRVVSTVLVALFAAVALVAPVNADPIQRAQLEQMFAQMRANAPWNVDGPLLWGYFFTSRDRDRLERASGVLAAKGYRVVDISQRDTGVWWLHVERVEHHTVDSLNKRNLEFYAFAQGQGLDTYDGMDVGPPP
jgi:hypothetical protein